MAQSPLIGVLLIAACATNPPSRSEPDWTKDLAALIPAIDACRAAVPRFRISPGTSISFARSNADGTATIRLGASSVESIEDPSKVHVTHHAWECTTTADGQRVAEFKALRPGTKRLPGELKPSFTRADPRILCFEDACLKTRVFATDGKLLGYLFYWQDAPDALMIN